MLWRREEKQSEPPPCSLVFRECLERALDIYEECYQYHHPSVAVALTNLGAVMHSLGETEKSKEPLKQALDMAEHLYEPNHPSVSNYVLLDGLRP